LAYGAGAGPVSQRRRASTSSQEHGLGFLLEEFLTRAVHHEDVALNEVFAGADRARLEPDADADASAVQSAPLEFFRSGAGPLEDPFLARALLQRKTPLAEHLLDAPLDFQ
jgi:hypothetical protein